jgi:hypothetical protein
LFGTKHPQDDVMESGVRGPSILTLATVLRLVINFTIRPFNHRGREPDGDWPGRRFGGSQCTV